MLLSIDDELHRILMELSEESGVPAATYAAQLLESAKPQLKALTETFRLAKTSPNQALDMLMDTVNKQQEVAEKWKKVAAQEKKKLK
jgi:hypothetical protein